MTVYINAVSCFNYKTLERKYGDALRSFGFRRDPEIPDNRGYAILDVDCCDCIVKLRDTVGSLIIYDKQSLYDIPDYVDLVICIYDDYVE